MLWPRSRTGVCREKEDSHHRAAVCRKKDESCMNLISAFLLGISIGAMLQRFVIYKRVGSITPTICDYCKWRKENQWRWEKRKNRHKHGGS